MRNVLLILLLIPLLVSAQSYRYNSLTGMLTGVDEKKSVQQKHNPVFSSTNHAGTPYPDWEVQADYIFFVYVDEFHFSNHLWEENVINQFRVILQDYPAENYFRYWATTADLDVKFYDNLSKGIRASKLDDMNSQHTAAWLRMNQVIYELGSDKERDALVYNKEQRGIYLYLVPKPKTTRDTLVVEIPVYPEPQPVQQTVAEVSPCDSTEPWFGTYVQYSHDGWGRETAKPVDRHELGFYVQGDLLGTWTARFTPVVYKGIINFDNITREYTAGSIGLQYNMDLSLIKGFVRGTADYSYESNNMDEYQVDGGLRFSIWKLYAEGSGKVSLMRPLFGIRDSSAYYQKLRGRVGLELWDDFSFGGQISYSYYDDQIQERDHKPYSDVEDGMPWGVFIQGQKSYCVQGLRLKCYFDVSYERTFYSRRWKETNFWEDPMIGVVDANIGLQIEF